MIVKLCPDSEEGICVEETYYNTRQLLAAACIDIPAGEHVLVYGYTDLDAEARPILISNLDRPIPEGIVCVEVCATIAA